jgi:hypothetical protein
LGAGVGFGFALSSGIEKSSRLRVDLFSRPYGTGAMTLFLPGTEVPGYFHSPLRGWWS